MTLGRYPLSIQGTLEPAASRKGTRFGFDQSVEGLAIQVGCIHLNGGESLHQSNQGIQGYLAHKKMLPARTLRAQAVVPHLRVDLCNNF